jgi:hypothetical protein
MQCWEAYVAMLYWSLGAFEELATSCGEEAPAMFDETAKRYSSRSAGPGLYSLAG